MSLDELLLRHPATLWRARVQVAGGSAAAAPQVPVLPSGYAALDRCLPGGGWPQQGLVEILTDRNGIGELSLLMPALATLCGDAGSGAGAHEAGHPGGWLAWVSPPYQPYAPALAAGGIDVRRVLVVRAKPAEWAMEQALRSESCSAVLGWAEPRDPHALRRLQLAAEQSRCLAVLFRGLAAGASPSPAVLRLALHASGHEALQVTIVKSRGGRPATVQLPRH